MTEAKKVWRSEGVRVVRAAALREAMGPGGMGRATVFDFDGSGGAKTWIGSVILPPGAVTGGHHHGRHEVALGVISGKAEIRWGEALEFVADLGPGDWAYFPPFVPHQERNPSDSEPLQAIAVRSDNERIVEKIPGEVTASPERIA